MEQFWCLAIQNTTLIKRRCYNRMRKNSPYNIVHGKKASIKELVPCGSLMTIIDPDKNNMPKLSQDQAKRGYFCAFGNNLKFCLYWDETSPYIIKRSFHCIIENTATFAILEDKIFSSSGIDEINITDDIKHKMVTDDTLNICDTAFPDKDIKTITLTLPPAPQPLGLRLMDDLLYNLPFIASAVRNSFAYDNFPAAIRTNHYIIAINADCPLTKDYAITMLRNIQKSKDRQCTIDLVHRGNADNTTSLNVSRVMFDNFPNYLQRKPVISSIHVPPTHHHFVTSPVKPDTPRSFFECLK